MTRPFVQSLLSAIGLGAKPSPPAATDSAAGDAPGGDASAWALSESAWRDRLTPAQFDVLRRAGTERPGASRLNAEKRPGTYACAGCGLALFTAEMKFDSGTGWPSFHSALPGAFGLSTDFKAIFPRTEYHCSRCGGHHGHVFDDGPAPSGKRYCNNGVALTFNFHRSERGRFGQPTIRAPPESRACPNPRPLT